MEMVAVRSGRDVAGLPLPAAAHPRLSRPPDGEEAVLTAFLSTTGELCVDGACDPVPMRIAGVVSRTRAAAAWAARADAELAAAYLWGAAEFATRSGAPTPAQRREWGAREMLTELALALRLPEGTLARRLTRITTLAALPQLRDANARGEISSWHLDVVLDVFRGVDDLGVLERADAFLVGRAARMTAPELRASARGWRSRHVPRTDEQRRRSLADRSVTVTPADDDLCWLTALVPAAQAIAIDHRLDDLAAAVAGDGDERTRAQVRADALCDLLLNPGGSTAPVGVPAGGPVCADEDASRHDEDGAVDDEDGVVDDEDRAADDARPGGDAGRARQAADTDTPDGPAPAVPVWLSAVKPEVVLTVPVLSLLGRSDEPAMLEGFGPIDMETARLLAAHAPSFIRVLTHPETGAVLSVGRDRYRIPADLRRVLQLRDVTCRFPGCRRRARRCDVDHSRAWADGGSTALCNLACLCRKHHRLKHQMRWIVTQEPGGRLRWRTPTGTRYWTDPGGVWPPRPAPPPEAERTLGESSPRESPRLVGAARTASGYLDEPPF